MDLVNKEITSEKSDIETALTILKRTSLDTHYLKRKVNNLAQMVSEIEKKTDSTVQIKFYEEEQIKIERKNLLNTKDELIGKLLHREGFKSGKSPLQIKAKEIHDSIVKYKEEKSKQMQELEEVKLHEENFKQFNEYLSKNQIKN